MAESIPSDWALNLADTLADYIAAIFKELIELDSTNRETVTPAIPDLHLSMHLVAECEHAATVLARAYQNQVVIPWPMEDYSACLPKHQAATRVLDTADRLSERFPPMNPKVKLTDPATIVDARGCVLVWYLPDVLLQDRQITLRKSVTMLNCVLSKPSAAKNVSWRQSAELFKAPEPGSALVSGEIKMSPAQFQLGHMAHRFHPEVSRTLKSGNGCTECWEWVKTTEDAAALFSAITGVAHPNLYIAGRSVFAAMQDNNAIADCLIHWGSVFSGLNVIVNRRTPPHHDTGTLAEWYDLLATIGGDADTEMELLNLGVTLQYRSGCLVLFSGASILHTVAETVADRLCLAYYMKKVSPGHTAIGCQLATTRDLSSAAFDQKLESSPLDFCLKLHCSVTSSIDIQLVPLFLTPSLNFFLITMIQEMCPICRPVRIVARRQRRSAYQVSFDPDNQLCYNLAGLPYPNNGMCPGRKLMAIRADAKEWVRQDNLRRRRERIHAAQISSQLAAELKEEKRIRRRQERAFDRRAIVEARRQQVKRLNISGHMLKSYRLDSEE